MKHNLYSEEAEKAFAGAAIIAPEVVMGDVAVALKLTEEMFHVPAYRRLFKTVHAMLARGMAVDMLTVGEALRVRGELASVGGPEGIEGAVDSSSVAFAHHHGEIISGMYWKRRVAEKSGEAIEMSATDASAEECASVLITEMDKVLNSRTVSRTIDEVNDSVEKSWDLKGIPSRFQRMASFFMYDGMVVLGAYPSVGKTATLCHETIGWCQSGLHVAGASLEMSEERIRERMACSLAGIEASGLRKGRGRDEARRALREIAKWPLTITDEPMTCDRFCAWARAMKSKGAQVIWLDYLQLFSASKDEWHMPAERMISMWSNKIKAAQKAVGIPIVVLSQLSRPAMKDASAMPPPPTLTSLRYSGSIEQDADSVLLLYKDPDLTPAYFLENQMWPEYIDIAKQRNGETGRVKVLFNRPLQQYTDEVEALMAGVKIPQADKEFNW